MLAKLSLLYKSCIAVGFSSLLNELYWLKNFALPLALANGIEIKDIKGFSPMPVEGLKSQSQRGLPNRRLKPTAIELIGTSLAMLLALALS